MPCIHEFGIVDEIDKMKSYTEYTPQKYYCISVDDDLINSLSEQLSIMKTYFHSLKRAEFGLDYWGITIIPPESLSIFYDVISTSPYFKKSAELNDLASIIIQASEDKKYIIHYGV